MIMPVVYGVVSFSRTDVVDQIADMKKVAPQLMLLEFRVLIQALHFRDF